MDHHIYVMVFKWISLYGISQSHIQNVQSMAIQIEKCARARVYAINLDNFQSREEHPRNCMCYEAAILLHKYRVLKFLTELNIIFLHFNNVMESILILEVII